MANLFKNTNMSTIITAIGSVVTMLVAVAAFNNYYITHTYFTLVTDAQACEIKKLNVTLALTNDRLEQKIIADQLYMLKKRKWMLEDRLRLYPNEQGIRNEIRSIEHDIMMLSRKIHG